MGIPYPPGSLQQFASLSLPPVRRTRTKARAVTASALLSLWFIGLLVVGASLLARHVLALPQPHHLGHLSEALATLHADDPRVHHDADGKMGQHFWSATHVLYADCRCSERIAETLATTDRPADLRETVLFIGQDAELEAKLGARGFRVEEMTADDLARRFDIKAAPMLILQDPSGEVRYVGGYTETKQGLVPRDRQIFKDLEQGAQVTSLPVYGCAVSADLRAKTNPLGLP